MKKCLVLFCVFLIMMPFLVACDESNQKLVMVKNVDDEEGWVWKQKVILKQTDIDRIIQEVDSLNLTTESEDQSLVYGAGLIIIYIDKKGNEFNYTLAGSKVNKNGIYFDMVYGADDKLRELYDSLNYEETRYRNN